MKRRDFMLGGVGLVTAGAGLAGYRYFPPSPQISGRTPSTIAVELVSTLNANQADSLLASYDSPFRQYHNRGVWAGGELVAKMGFNRPQLSLVSELMYAGLSEQGRHIIPQQFFSRLPNIMVHNLQIFGDPVSDEFMAMVSGPHLNLRIGGANNEGMAFGGPQVYGDQQGNEAPGLPGNVYLPTLTLGSQIFDSLDPTLQSLAVLEVSPTQTRIELQGADGHFSGLPVREMSGASQSMVDDLIDLILSPYPARDVAFARECLSHNGGLRDMHVAWYADSGYGKGTALQTFRIEGPGSVLYFRGYPHLHAFINIGMDGDSGFSVGEVIFENPTMLEGRALGALMEESMKATEGTDLAYYTDDSIAGYLPRGIIRAGDIYNAESWESEVVVLSARGSDIRGVFRERLTSAGTLLDDNRHYTIATSDYVADSRLGTDIGQAREIRRGGLLRESMISHLSSQQPA